MKTFFLQIAGSYGTSTACPEHLRAVNAESLVTDDALLLNTRTKITKSVLKSSDLDSSNPLFPQTEIMSAVVSSSLRTVGGLSVSRGIRKRPEGYKASVDGATGKQASSEMPQQEVKHSVLHSVLFHFVRPEL